MRIVVIYIVVITVVYIVHTYYTLYSESHAAGPMHRMGFTVTEYARSLLAHCDHMVISW